MEVSYQIPGLAAYFGQSRSFYYFLLDPYGNCKYINPLLQNEIGIEDENLQSLAISAMFIGEEGDRFRKACEQCLRETGQIEEIELRITNKKGDYFVIKWEISGCYDSDGKIAYLQGIGHASPLSPAGFSEKNLQDSELFYKNLIAESLDGIVLSDVNGVIEFASPCIKKILGYDVEEVLGRTLFSFAHPDDIELAVQTFKDEIKNSQQIKFINIRLIRKNGESVWCIVRGHNMLDNPYIGKMVIYFSDDTLRKKSEEALIESENKFRKQATILNNVTDVIVTTDLHRNVTSWNSVIEKLTGVPANAAVGKRFRDVINTDYSPFTHDQVAEIVMKEGVWRGEISFTSQNGAKKYLLHTVSMLYSDTGESIGMLGVGKDVTERKKAETRLQESELFYRRLSYYSIDGVLMSDETGTITYCGPSVEKISGYETAQLLGRNLFEFIHPDDIPAAADAFYKELKKESVLNYMFLRLKHSSGEWTWCTVRGHNLLDVPELNTFIIYFTNDTKRKEAEDQLRRSEENFRSLIANLKQGVILLDKDAKVTICNQAALEMLGLTEKDILDKHFSEYSFDVIRENGQKIPGSEFPISVLLRTGKPVRDVILGVNRESTKSRVWLMVNAEPIAGSDGKLHNIVCSIIDITEQKRLAKELFEQEVQKQKLIVQAAIDGQEKERQEIGKELHDNINQYLTTARLYLEVAKEKSTGEVQEMINLSHKTLSDIVKEIRKMSQSLVPPTLGDIGLVESVQELLDSIRQAHPIQIEFHHRYFAEAALTGNMKLMFFRIIQEQVNNILRHSEAVQMEVILQSDAEIILLTIADNGKGFDLAQYKKGRGLGNISNRAGLFNGKMEIETAPGKGCAISVSIPVSDEQKALI